MLYRQKIKGKRISEESLSNLYAQQTNRKFLFFPISPLVWIYYVGEKRYDPDKYVRKREAVEKKFDAKIGATTSQRKIDNLEIRKQQKLERLNRFIEEGNLGMQWGEPVVVFDTGSVTLTKERFAGYLFAQGYFTAKIDSHIEHVKGIFWPKRSKELLVKVFYDIAPGPAYIIDSVFYTIPDTAVARYVFENQKESLIKKGSRYNENNLTKERERIDLLLKDNGFYDFSRQYIEYNVDSATLSPSRKLILQMAINDPAKRDYHKQFLIDSVNLTLDAGAAALPGIFRQRRPYRQIQYAYYQNNYNLKILSQRVFLQPGESYSRSRTLNTQRQLANLDAFKFININYDTTQGKFIANIFTSPLPRYEWSNEAGVSVTQGYPGPFYSVSFRKRNIFKGLENFELSGRFGFEGVASATQEQNIYKSTEASLNASLTFPQFIWPLSERTRFKLAQYNPRTRLTIGYAYTDRPEYRRTAVSVNGSYSWQHKNRSFFVTPFNVSVIDTANLSDLFKVFLARQDSSGNLSLINSFRPSLINSIIFGITWNKNNYGNIESNSAFIRVQLESGGTIWNVFDPSFISEFDLQYFKYLRLSADLRRIKVFNKTTTLAHRLNAGVAYPYASHKSLPYEKFFFAGGVTSIRAWYPRRLGPGSFKPDSSSNPRKDGLFSYRIEQPGDILLEASVELRKKLFGFVSGALFIDAGNTWTFQPRRKFVGETQLNNGNSEFRFDQFYKEIGVGTGFGLRFDFTFLIIRFDVGIKAYDPAREENDRFVLNKVRFWRPYATQLPNGSFTRHKEPVIYNVGIGYSF